MTTRCHRSGVRWHSGRIALLYWYVRGEQKGSGWGNRNQAAQRVSQGGVTVTPERKTGIGSAC